MGSTRSNTAGGAAYTEVARIRTLQKHWHEDLIRSLLYWMLQTFYQEGIGLQLNSTRKVPTLVKKHKMS